MEKYHMRRQDRQISDENEIDDILSQGKYIVISMCRDNEPYIVSLSYGFDKSQNAIFMHTGPEGLKMDFLSCNPNVCAAIIDDKGYITGTCAHEYRSVVINGIVSVVQNPDDKKHGMEIILQHLEKNSSKPLNENAFGNVAILKMDIVHLTAKKGQ